ncbi:MAG TPA: hypothetical protein VN223_06595 [Candidatus Elarobacter sp.]|nr:hypothetical protein [Candidatus Elarobacter sp.]
MNRRRLLQAMLSVPVAGALGGCRHEHTDPHRFPPSRGGTLKVVLQGPFAVVIDTKNHYKIKAFVPYSDNNEHEFLYPGQSDHGNKNIFPEAVDGKRNQYQFTLEEKNLEPSDRMPHIDAGFADFTLQVSGWQPSANDYFVSLDLPAPDLISYRIPAEPALLAGNKLVLMPTSHVLQYRIHDFDDLKKVKMGSPQLGERHPLSCTDLSAWAQDRGVFPGQTQETDSGRAARDERMGRMKTEFQCSNDPVSWLFFGVGLPYPQPEESPHLYEHGLDFFNKKLLGAFPTARDLDEHRLVQVKVNVCGAGAGAGRDSMFVSAVQRYPMPQARMVPVTSLTDCRAGALNAINS